MMLPLFNKEIFQSAALCLVAFVLLTCLLVNQLALNLVAGFEVDSVVINKLKCMYLHARTCIQGTVFDVGSSQLTLRASCLLIILQVHY